MSIDPRIAARRAEVREGTARRDVRRVLRWMTVAAVLAVAAWVAQLPAFRVQHIEVSGAERADVAFAVADSGVALGRPLVLLWPPAVERALADDPWIVSAVVSHRFPDTVAVDVVERRPVVTVHADGRAIVVAADGYVVSHTADETLATAQLAGVAPGAIGEKSPDRRLEELAAFVAELPPRLAGVVEITEEAGELTLAVSGATVRLGRAVDMAAKARTLTALLDEGVPAGATIHLVSASRPAVEVPAETPTETVDEPADDGEETP